MQGQITAHGAPDQVSQVTQKHRAHAGVIPIGITAADTEQAQAAGLQGVGAAAIKGNYHRRGDIILGDLAEQIVDLTSAQMPLGRSYRERLTALLS